MGQKRKWTNRNDAQQKVGRLWEDSPLMIASKNSGNRVFAKKLGIHGLSAERRTEIGLRNGYRNMKLGIGLIARSKQKRIEDARKAGTVSGEKYKGKYFRKWAEENPELAYEIKHKNGKKQGRINVESGHLDWLHKTYSKENAKYFDYDERVCPNCKRTIKGLAPYSRFHGDKCTYLDKINKQKEILSSLPNEFNSNDVSRICKELNFNRKTIKYGICRDERYIEVLHKGTNQHNPSIFKKLF